MPMIDVNEGARTCQDAKKLARIEHSIWVFRPWKKLARSRIGAGAKAQPGDLDVHAGWPGSADHLEVDIRLCLLPRAAPQRDSFSTRLKITQI